LGLHQARVQVITSMPLSANAFPSFLAWLPPKVRYFRGAELVLSQLVLSKIGSLPTSMFNRSLSSLIRDLTMDCSISVLNGWTPLGDVQSLLTHVRSLFEFFKESGKIGFAFCTVNVPPCA